MELGSTPPEFVPTLLSSGNFADVFDLGEGRVVKVFRRHRHTRRDIDPADDDLLTRGFFVAEATAYEQLAQYEDLSIYVPRYYGRVDPLALDIAAPAEHAYVRGCGFVVERLNGIERKLHALEEPLQRQVEEVIDRMQERMVLGHPWDGSCFVPGSRAPFAIIDFATWSDWSDYYESLEERGQLSNDERRRLNLHVVNGRVDG